jgi:hypothetical protein
MPNWGGGATGALSGAGKGAAIGSVVPVLGTGVGAGVGAIIGGIKGLFSKKKKKPGEDGAADSESLVGDVEGLREESGEQRARADALGMQGDAAIAPVMQHYKDILNDPQANMAATRGQRGRVIDQFDSARQAASRFGARGGGTNAAIADSYFAQASSLNDIASNAQNDAAAQLGQLGTTMTGLGLSADQLASADISTVIQAVLGQQSIDQQGKAATMGMWGDIGTAAGSIIGGVLAK